MPRKKDSGIVLASGSSARDVTILPNEMGSKIEVHGTLGGVTLDFKFNSPKGARPLLTLLDEILNALGPPPGWKPPAENEKRE